VRCSTIAYLAAFLFALSGSRCSNQEPAMSDIIQIVTTVPDEESAQRIARALVEARLAACVQVAGPVESVYRWQGQI
jgi:hypothetical protein